MKKDNLFNKANVITIGKYLLKPLSKDNLEDVFELYSDNRSVEYQAGKVMVEISEAQEFIESAINGIQNGYFLKLAIYDNEINEFIGIFSIHHMDYVNDKCQFGFLMNQKYRNQGIMRKILKEISDDLTGDDGFNKVELLIHPENIASIKTAEKAGYSKENLLTAIAYNKNTDLHEDRILMSRVRKRSSYNTLIT